MARVPRNRWSKARARPARFRPRRRALTWRQAWFETRPWIFGIAFVTIAAVHQTPGFYEPPAWLQSDPDRIEGALPAAGRAEARSA